MAENTLTTEELSEQVKNLSETIKTLQIDKEKILTNKNDILGEKKELEEKFSQIEKEKSDLLAKQSSSMTAEESLRADFVKLQESFGLMAKEKEIESQKAVKATTMATIAKSLSGKVREGAELTVQNAIFAGVSTDDTGQMFGAIGGETFSGESFVEKWLDSNAWAKKSTQRSGAGSSNSSGGGFQTDASTIEKKLSEAKKSGNMTQVAFFKRQLTELQG